MRIGTLDRLQWPDTTANITIERKGRKGREETLLASKQRVDEWGDGARLRKHDEQPEQDEPADDRDEPVLLTLTKEETELGEDTALAHISLNTAADSAGGPDSESGTASIPGFPYGVRAGLCRSDAR